MLTATANLTLFGEGLFLRLSGLARADLCGEDEGMGITGPAFCTISSLSAACCINIGTTPMIHPYLPNITRLFYMNVCRIVMKFHLSE